jgi:urease accessory protein
MTDSARPVDAPLPRVHQIAPAGASGDMITLDYDARFVRRKRMVSDGGRAFLNDLPTARSLAAGEVLLLDDGTRICVGAAPEPLLAVRGPLVRLAWHIGNRHTPCQIAEDHLLIRDDKVLAGMLRGLGADVAPITAPFTPEGGAYGHGRTFGHAHGTGGHDHAPATPAEGHSHD